MRRYEQKVLRLRKASADKWLARRTGGLQPPVADFDQQQGATLELSENQIQGLLDVTEEMTSIICGAEESGMNVADYAEYITGKADECRARLEAKP